MNFTKRLTTRVPSNRVVALCTLIVARATTLVPSLALTLALTACGSYDVNFDDIEADARISGESYSYLVVRLEFLSQLIELCADLVLDEDYETLAQANQARAQCVFDKLDSLGQSLPSLPEFEEDLSDLCAQPPESLTPEQLAQYTQVCTGLGLL